MVSAYIEHSIPLCDEGESLTVTFIFDVSIDMQTFILKKRAVSELGC